MIMALGTGIKEDYDESKLRYHCIVIMTDADVDGSHIRTLLLTFFYRQMPELVERGHLFIAQPPLYKVKRGKQERYIKDETGLEDYLVEIGTDEIRVKTSAEGNGLVGQPLQSFIKKVLRWERLMAMAARKRRSRAVIEGVLLEDGFSEEALKDQSTLKRLQSNLESSLASSPRTRRRLLVRWKKMPNMAALSLSAKCDSMAPGCARCSTASS